MSDLETKAQPILSEMACGHPIVLNRDQQEVAATWAIKTAMVAESLETTRVGNRFYTDADRSEFGRTRIPPVGSHVWLAHHIGSGVASVEGRILGRGAKAARKSDTEGCAMTVTMSEFVCQVVTFRGDSASYELDGGRVGQTTTVQVWPSISITVAWPPPRAVNDDGLSALANRWGQAKIVTPENAASTRLDDANRRVQ